MKWRCVRIWHPGVEKEDRTVPRHFVAFGWKDGSRVTGVTGYLKRSLFGDKIFGTTVADPDPDFWSIRFDVAEPGKYRLTVRAEGCWLKCDSVRITVQPVFGGFVVSYPVTFAPPTFVSYGGSDYTGYPSGTLNGSGAATSLPVRGQNWSLKFSGAHTGDYPFHIEVPEDPPTAAMNKQSGDIPHLIIRNPQT